MSVLKKVVIVSLVAITIGTCIGGIWYTPLFAISGSSVIGLIAVGRDMIRIHRRRDEGAQTANAAIHQSDILVTPPPPVLGPRHRNSTSPNSPLSPSMPSNLSPPQFSAGGSPITPMRHLHTVYREQRSENKEHGVVTTSSFEVISDEDVSPDVPLSSYHNSPASLRSPRLRELREQRELSDLPEDAKLEALLEPRVATPRPAIPPVATPALVIQLPSLEDHPQATQLPVASPLQRTPSC